MNIVLFKGHHSLITHANASLLPDQGNHSLWQAWLMPSGNYIIQALDSNKTPEGDVYLIEADLFHQTLTPVLATICPATRSDDTNVIHEWYNEVANLKGQDFYGPPITDYSQQSLPPLHPLTLEAIADHDAASAEAAAAAGNNSPSSEMQTKHPANTSSDSPPALGTVLQESAPHGNGTESFSTAEPQEPPGYCMSACPADIIPTQLAAILQYVRTGNKQLAEEQTLQFIDSPALKYDPARQSILTELGLELRREQMYHAARQCHLRALEITPDDERILFNVARTEYEAGNIEAAKKYLKRCLEVAPEFNVARNFLAFISTGA